MRVPLPVVPRPVRWLAVLAVAGLVFYLSILTVPPEQPVVTGPPDLVPLDKWRHFLAYAALGGSLAYATVDWEWQTPWLAALVIGTTVAYGVGIELMQAPLAERYFSVGDAYANALGGALVLPWFLVRDRLSLVRIGS